uniref:C-type lectin domain-containing protein n=1 Tax=Steinernema glaseri TaxID=37863 RepID=A0A1I7YPV4_9BILA
MGADSYIHGNEDITDCAFIAFSKKSAAFYHFSNTSGTYCGIVDKVSVEPKKNPDIQYYLIDADLTEIDRCPDGAQSACDVAQEAKSCNYDKAICDTLAELANRCNPVKEVNQEKKCAQGQKVLQGNEDCCKFITHKDGREECCEHIWNDQDGQEYCCPENKPCCEEMTGHNSFCCPKGKENGNKGGGAVCCPIGTFYRAPYGQQAVCCPDSYHGMQGTPFCCPSGFHYFKSFGKCVGAFDIAGRKPKNPSQMKKLCTDLKSLPVKIENKQQNDDLNHIDTWNVALIGLHIPEGQPWGKNNYRWISDDSKPSYTNWNLGEPNNVYPDEIFVETHKATSVWWDIDNSNYWVPSYIICMADAHLGVDEQQ